MSLDDFYSVYNRHLRVFYEQYKRLHAAHPEHYPLELPSFSDWEEQFTLFSETIEE